MRSPNRSLALEAVEDRCVPAYYFMVPAHADIHTALVPTHERVADGAHYTRGWERAVTINDTTFRVRADEPVVFLRLPATSFFDRFGFAAANDTPARRTADTPRFDAPRAETSPVRNDGPGPVAPQAGRAGNGVRAPETPVTAGNVAFAPNTPADADGLPPAVGQAGSSAARVGAAQNNPPAVLFAGQTVVGRGAGYATLGGPGTDDAAGPPAGMMPDGSPAPAPSPADPDDGSLMVQAAAAVAAPVAGALAIDLAALKVGTSQFLDQVADLAPSWPDDMPSLGNSLWIGAAVLLAGGAIYAAAHRPAARTARDPFRTGTGLSDWEPRNAGQAG